MPSRVNLQPILKPTTSRTQGKGVASSIKRDAQQTPKKSPTRAKLDPKDRVRSDAALIKSLGEVKNAARKHPGPTLQKASHGLNANATHRLLGPS